MRTLITGAKGQLGTDLTKELNKRGIEVVGLDVSDMDITDEKQVEQVLGGYLKNKDIDAVIHCAAHTAVDRAEDEVELARSINALGTKYIVDQCKKYDVKMMYISTDYVFDGEGTRAFKPYDKRQPVNVYGQTKYEGELYVEQLDKMFIVRISWVFGLHGNNFIKTMLKLGKEKKELNVVNDQIGSPTYTPHLSVLLADMIMTNEYGIYHATNEGLCSWYDFAVEIFKQSNMPIIVHPVSSEEFKVKAKRPHNSRMDKSDLVKHGFKLLPPWQEALREYLEELNN